MKRFFLAAALFLFSSGGSDSAGKSPSSPEVSGVGDLGMISRIEQWVAEKVFIWAAKSGETEAVIGEHELHGVSPEMINWWWDHIDTTARYRLWHPKDHTYFTWTVSPETGHVGAISRCTEKIAGIPMTFNIRWEDPKTVQTEFQYVHVASILADDGTIRVRFMHEYEATSSGTRMRSTFYVPKKVPAFFKKGLMKHNREEMANFEIFLPGLFQAEANRH